MGAASIGYEHRFAASRIDEQKRLAAITELARTTVAIHGTPEQLVSGPQSGLSGDVVALAGMAVGADPVSSMEVGVAVSTLWGTE